MGKCMQTALKRESRFYPEGWQQFPLGEQMLAALERALADPVRQMFGYHLLKLGKLSSALQLPNCPIQHRISLGYTPAINTDLCSLRSRLALQENSIDAVVMANELDFARDPHQILREVNRVIIPNGHLMIAGFNPFSLAGVVKYLPVKSGSPLHQARFFSRSRVKDWLHLLGFEVVEQYSLVYSELLFERQLNPKSQQFARRYLPGTAAMYLLIARKRVVPLSLIKPRWAAKPRFSVVNVSASRSCNDQL